MLASMAEAQPSLFKCAGGDASAVGGQDYLDFKGKVFDRVSRLVYARGFDESVPVLSIKQLEQQSINWNNKASIGTTFIY